MAVKETKNDFSQGSVPKLIWKLAVPMIVAQVVNALYSIVDRVYIGHMAGVGQLALTGIGLCFPITMTVAAFSALIGYGGAPLSSILRGRKDADGAERVLGNSVSALCVLGILIPLACFFLRRPVLYLFGASDATFPYADQYITIYLTGSLPVMLTLGLNAFINAQGFTRDGMVTVGIGAVLNLALDPLFIFAFHMGIAGAAVATVISQTVSCLWVLRFLLGKKNLICLRRKYLRPDWPLLGEDLCAGRVQLHHADHRERHLRRVQRQSGQIRRRYLRHHHDGGYLHQPDLFYGHSGLWPGGPACHRLQLRRGTL